MGDISGERCKWIAVSEQRPEYDTDVHLWAPGWKHVYLGYWRHSEEWIGRCRPEETNGELPDTEPTYWMPMPEPPAFPSPTQREPEQVFKFTPPRYDDTYYEAMNMIDEIDGRPHTFAPATQREPVDTECESCDIGPCGHEFDCPEAQQ